MDADGVYIMVFDPAFDMPKIRWQPQGSFEVGIIPLVDNPDDGPLVCLPPINQHWLPLLLGCLDQLRNPSTWITASESATFDALQKSTRLMQMIGDRSECNMYELRLTDTGELQFSVDGGVTWTTVTGWVENLCAAIATCIPTPPVTGLRLESCQLQTTSDDGVTWVTTPGWDPGFAECVQEQIPNIGIPENPGGEPHDQFACSIAGYLADDVILKAITQAIASISDDIALLGFGTVILDLIPEFVLVTVAYNALYLLYTAIHEGTIADYEAARDDPALWIAVRCAIYECIVTDGYVKPTNFACIVSNIEAISYVHSDVIDTIVAFLNSLGATGLAQLSQRAGLVPGADCSDCTGAWCYEWDGPTSSGDPSMWSFVDEGTPAGEWSPGTGFVSFPFAAGVTAILFMTYDWGYEVQIDNVIVTYTCPAAHGVGVRHVNTDTSSQPLDNSAGTFTTTCPFGFNSESLTIELDSGNIDSGAGTNVISHLKINGRGVSPFPPSNC